MNIRRIIHLALCFSWLAIIASCGGKSTTGPDNPDPLSITDGPNLTLGFNSALVSWSTNRLSSAVVYYGLQSGNLSESVTRPGQMLLHEITLSNLISDTTYYFRVESSAGDEQVASSETPFATLKTIANFIADGWQAYESGDYLQAVAEFRGAVVSNQPGGRRDAYNGLGWSYASNAIDSLGRAKENFDVAIQQNISFTEAYAGRGFVNMALKKYTDAVADFNKTLDLDANFSFSHNPAIDARDIRLGLMESYFFSKNYTAAQGQVDILEPGNGLDAGNSATWQVDSINYATYVEALLAWIEKLRVT